MRWKPIPDFPAYEVSDEGAVRSLRFDPPKIMGQRPMSQGYLRVGLYRGRGQEDQNVHVLVARAFLPEPEPGQEVRHKNSNPRDNRAVNLAWGTRQENVDDMMAAGTHYKQRVTHCPRNHEYTEENTYISKRGNGKTFRVCRTCKRERRNNVVL